MGVEVIFGEARFEGDHRLRAGERTVTTKFVLVCTGSRPSAPPIAGLHEAGYLTSQTFFDLERPPSSLAVIGAGPIGVEVAQAMNRLGAKVVLLERRERILEKDEPELAAILLQRLRDEGVEVHVGAELESVAAVEGGKEVRATVNGATMEWLVEDVFVATGRRANIEGLGLETMGVRTRNAAIAVDDRLRTSVEWIYAAGDCAGRYLFTHSATAEAAIAVRNMFFPGSSVAPSPMSWTTFSDPELAHVGMTREEAEGKLGRARVRCWSWDLSRSDRARAESADGKLMVITDNHFRLLGAHLLAPSAGEMIGQFTLAIRHGLRLTPDFTRTIQVYPTFSTSVAQIALEATYNQLQKPFLRAMRWLNRRLLGG
jgi:pyruvate/2-oxoglutarate dehydrogenase complex dihydrolipoamide dehydrogenase (E3) component